MQKPRVIARVVVVALLLLVAVVTVTVTSRATRRTTPSVAIPADQLPVVSAAAHRGSAGAAAQLSRHYLEARDYRSSWVWMQRAQQFGDPAAESNLAEMRKFFPPDALIEEADATR